MTMTTSKIKSLSAATIGGLALAVLSHTSAADQMTQAPADGHSVVHRVTHSIAADTSYTASEAGYKWSRVQHSSPAAVNNWNTGKVEGQSGYKWSQARGNVNPNMYGSSFAASNYAEEAGYRWGLRNFSEQSGYRWGLRNFSEQSGYRWGLRNFSEQSGYRWGLRNFSEQSGYRWGLRNFSEHSGYRWGLR